MATTPETLTPGSDAPADSAASSATSTPPSAADISVGGESQPRGALQDAKAKIGEQAIGLKEQAADKARDYAAVGKDKAVAGLDNVIRLIDEAATTVDDKAGQQYGDYVRRAGEAVAGVATSLRDKDVDQLIDDARTVVRKSPALAIGAAIAVGFVAARLVKSGQDAASGAGTAQPVGTTDSSANTANGPGA